VCRRRQIFEIWIRPVPPEAGHFALRAALREYQLLVENGLTKEQFSLTQNFLKKYLLNYAPTTMARLGYAIDDRFYGIPGSHLAQFRAMVGTLTLADVNRAIKKHLHYGTMVIAVVAKDAKGLHDELVNDLPSPITYRTKKPDSVQSEDKDIAVFPVKLAPKDITVVPVTEIFR
jgi:zinc protease